MTARRNPARDLANNRRQQRLRERRKADGWRRVSVWLSPQQVDRLELLGGDAWLGRTVKQLLGDVVDKGTAPGPQRELGLSDTGPAPERQQEPAQRSTAAPGKGERRARADVRRAFNAPLMAECEQLRAEGLSWGEIARRWNAAGRRTFEGAAFRGGDLARAYRRWKEQKV